MAPPFSSHSFREMDYLHQIALIACIWFCAQMPLLVQA
ncbi:hypothetical protein PSE_p0214 (plasmid) [Pseudovibrio sp. FO-BEG1]|nr:hypothetical protein PSE_p0214 [Pseudovibrio sp. FO-BEG1]EEA93382.1 hypothetical protein PJE062_3782 [Pseudovibrio sp. JE062]